MSEEAYPEAAAILARAGWKPHDAWNVYTRDTLVMGFQPDGLGFHVKNWAKVQPGDRSYSEDTPDTPEEAAAWLVERFKAPEPETNPLSLDTLEFRIEDEVAGLLQTHLAQEPEQVETPQHESDGETGEEADFGAPPQSDDPAHLGSDDDVELSAEHADGGSAGEPGAEWDGALASDAEPLDADFTIEDLGGPEEHLELPAPPPEDFIFDEMAEAEAAQSGAFIFGDNLDQLRTAAIGRVIRYANGLMPRWAVEDDARLAYLRNFAMGVSERRWDDDAANQAELNALETTIRRINEIKNARDAKVEFLEAASREEIQDFSVEADWP